MKIEKKDFPAFMASYTEDELFYKDLYLHEKNDPNSFQQYLNSIDPNYICQHKLYVPALHHEAWYPYLEESDLFINIPGNIMLSRHNRYTPVFTHKHEFFEILCVYDGEVDTTIHGIQHKLTTGDICIIPPNTLHSVGVFDDSSAFNIIIRASTFHSTFFQILADGSPLTQFFSHVLYRRTEGNYLTFHTGNDIQIRSALENLFIEYMGHKKYSSAFLNAQLIQLWAMLLRYHENDIESILTKEYGSSITKILNYLSLNYQTATQHETAKYFGYSVSHFSTLIKEGTGRTFLQIIRDIKLGQACRALRETQLSIHAICELVGYENPEHFMRTFKKIYGMTPKEYRSLEKYKNS